MLPTVGWALLCQLAIQIILTDVPTDQINLDNFSSLLTLGYVKLTVKTKQDTE